MNVGDKVLWNGLHWVLQEFDEGRWTVENNGEWEYDVRPSEITPVTVPSHRETDASVWAKSFVQHFPNMDEGTMLGWFANAMVAERDTEREKLKNILTEIESITRAYANPASCVLEYIKQVMP